MRRVRNRATAQWQAGGGYGDVRRNCRRGAGNEVGVSSTAEGPFAQGVKSSYESRKIVTRLVAGDQFCDNLLRRGSLALRTSRFSKVWARTPLYCGDDRGCV